MTKNYLDKLEYNKILNILSKYSNTYIGKKLCLNLLPFNKKDKVSKALSETSEALDLITSKGFPPLVDFPNIEISIKALESQSSLSAKALLDIATIFRISRELKNYFFEDKDFNFERNEIK